MGVSGLVDWQSQMAGMPITQAELATLRQANTEMREKLLQLQTSLQERENELVRVQRMQVSVHFFFNLTIELSFWTRCSEIAVRESSVPWVPIRIFKHLKDSISTVSLNDCYLDTQSGCRQ